MSRWLLHWCVAVIVVAGALAWCRAVPVADGTRPNKGDDVRPAKRNENPAVAIAQLNRKEDFAGFDDPKTTLGEALASLGKLYKVSLEVDEKAFKADMVMDVLKTEIAQASPIPALKQASLERVLRKVLARVAAASEACFVVRKDHIEITTGAARLAEFWPNGNENARANPEQPDQPANPPKVLPLVVMEFDNVPLSDALRELASATDYTIVLDARTGRRASCP